MGGVLPPDPSARKRAPACHGNRAAFDRLTLQNLAGKAIGLTP
jgi:hypothetical protein